GGHQAILGDLHSHSGTTHRDCLDHCLLDHLSQAAVVEFAWRTKSEQKNVLGGIFIAEPEREMFAKVALEVPLTHLLRKPSCQMLIHGLWPWTQSHTAHFREHQEVGIDGVKTAS